MALSQAQRDAIYAAMVLDELDNYASNPDSVIEEMTPEEFAQGLKCGTLSLEHLNYLLLYGFLATQKALKEAKDYTDGQVDAIPTVCEMLSPRVGNLLQTDVQADGSCLLYYGTIAPEEFRNTYVDYLSGNDMTGNGTRINPYKTIQHALSVGPVGVDRILHLHENQSHPVDPANTAVIRGGAWYFEPYGPAYDSLPPVPGAHKATQAAAKALNTRITAMNATEVNGFQTNTALTQSMGSFANFVGLRFIASGDNGSGIPRSRSQGCFGNYQQEGIAALFNCDVIVQDATAFAFDSYALSGFNLQLSNTVISGNGKLLTPDYGRGLTLSIDTDQNAANVAAYLPPLTTATKVITSFSTNLDANLFP